MGGKHGWVWMKKQDEARLQFRHDRLVGVGREGGVREANDLHLS